MGRAGKNVANKKQKVNNQRQTGQSSNNENMRVKPTWGRDDRLSEVIESHWQRQIFLDKVGSRSTYGGLILPEQKVLLSDFENYGVIQCFQRLGWMDALTFPDKKEDKSIYINEIVEWMSTLTKEKGKKSPKTTKIVGYVNDKKVVLSLDSLDKVVAFDTNSLDPEVPYEYVSEAEFISEETRRGPEWLKLQKVWIWKSCKSYKQDLI